MFRWSQLRSAALPFEPMALSTLDALEARLAREPLSPPTRSGGSSSRLSSPATYAQNPDLQDSCRWFDQQRSGAPFFVSPKHDGIRMLSYVAPAIPTAPTTTKSHGKHSAAVAAGRAGKRASTAAAAASLAVVVPATTQTTTYSRHGRALYGMFWVEKELTLLRALAGDPCLVLDGELYIHRQANSAATQAAFSREGVAAKTSKATVKSTARRRKESAGASGGDSFKTGFLAVSALCHRLRGSKSQCATVHDILQYVSMLPHYCLFDVAAYSPSMAPAMSLERRAVYPQPVAEALGRVLEETLASVGLGDAEPLRCTPNVTPFSQRVRTLHFLTELLARGVTSPVLQRAFGVREPAEVAAASEVSAAAAAAAPLPSVASGSSPAMPSRYRGGVFVKMVPYELVASLDEAKSVYLPLYEQRGYEGAVIRSPTNTYAMREKQKGVVRRLVAPMMALPHTLSVHSITAVGEARRRLRGGEIFDLSRGTRGGAFLRTYTQGRTSKAEKEDVITTTGAATSSAAQERSRAVVAVPDNSAAIAQLAIDRARHLPRRSETAVKLLPFKDKEYPVLRPLLKEPSTNPRTRSLLTVPVSVVYPDGDRSLIKVDPATARDASSRGAQKKVRRGKAAVRKNAAAAATAAEEEDMVVFYGLQCLAESGKVFNVTMPKLTPAQQRELLHHLLSSAKQRRKGSRGGGRSLTGTYVTVKFASLTEHGVPRFAQVKAIRGGKGWHM